MNPNRRRQLNAAEQGLLSAMLKAQHVPAASQGFAIRGQNLEAGPVMAHIPGTMIGAELSVCGLKGFMIDEYRQFTAADGSTITIPCAAVAVLEMVDSPVHVHAATQEVYVILEGIGWMVLGQGESERMVEVGPGSVILLPAKQQHGIYSKGGVKALLTFTPGLAPKDQPDYRDEGIVYPSTKKRLAVLRRRETQRRRRKGGG